MDKNFLIVGIILLILIAGGGIIYAMNRDATIVAVDTTSTPVTQDNTGNTNNYDNNQAQATAPLSVTNSSVSVSATTAIVNGTVNPKGSFTNYWYEYGKTTNLGFKTAVQSMGSGFIGIQAPAYITDLSKNTVYYFKLVSENAYGKVAGNEYTFETTEGTPAPVGNVPTIKTVTASNISSTTANLNGEVTANKTETQYWFEYGETPQLGNVSAFSSIGNGTDKIITSILLSDLKPTTSYYFRLNAQNQFGTMNGSILNFKTLGQKK